MKIIPFSLAALAVAAMIVSCGSVAENAPQAEQWDISVQITDLQLEKPRYEALIHNSEGGSKQMLEGYTSDYPQDMLESFGNVWQADVNFDGHTDVMICLGMMPANNHPITYYDAWLYDPQTDKFVFHKNFRLICNPQLDDANQYVLSYVVLPDGKTKKYIAYAIQNDGTVKKLKEWQVKGKGKNKDKGQ